MNQQPTQPPSLRRRYISLSLILGIIVVLFISNVYYNLAQRNQTLANDLSRLDKQLAISDQLKHQSALLYQYINLFLLRPEELLHSARIYDTLANLTLHASELESVTVQSDKNNSQQHLQSQLKQVSSEITQLIEIRLDPNRQYPGLALSANTMANQQDTVKGLLKLLQEEIELGEFKPDSPTLLNDLLEARILIEKIIAQIRIYIANRLALFSDEILSNQARSLEDIHYTFLEKIDQIISIYKNETGSFEGLANIKVVKKIHKEWFINFEILRELSESNHWREDSFLMEEKISPLIIEITNTLDEIKLALSHEKTTLNERFNESNKELLLILSVIIILFLLYIFMMQLSMNALVFKPIQNIAEVMQQKAFGLPTEPFSKRQSKETQDIITAFSRLENKVNSRTRDMKRAIEHAREAVKEAKIANRAKSEFLANMSHELRTPMHGILSFADLGTSKTGTVDDEKIKTYFAMITESGERLLLLLNDLLDLEKLEAGRAEMEMTENSLLATTQTAIKQLDALIQNKQITVRINIHKETYPDVAVYDGEKILQVISNLISNALKYAPANSNIDIFLKGEMLNNGNMVVLILEDNGPGIPDDELESVFDKFVQSSKTKTGAGGTGLGLSICYEIIKAHHGLIRAETKPDGSEGARFIFYLPTQQA